jgi:small subunit ribosomal protein S1
MKQLVPSGLDEYIAEHKEGDIVTGRMVETLDNQARVELGEGVHANCSLNSKSGQGKADAAPSSSLDMVSLSAMLNAKWKSGPATGAAKTESIRAGQVRSFRITKLDPATKKIDLELA